MSIARKALYNLLKLAEADGLELPGLQGWELEDFRLFSTPELFARLKMLGLSLNEEGFLAFSQEARTPEELSEILISDEAEEDLFDHAYLCLFELWRRLLPQKRPQSIFCNELDELVLAWYQEEENAEENAAQAIAMLKQILSEAEDRSHDPETLYAILSEGCAHHLSGFLYDYFREQLEEEDAPSLHSLEEIEKYLDFFEKFIDDPRWFYLLRVIVLEDCGRIEEAYSILLKIHNSLIEDYDGFIAQELMTEWFCLGARKEALCVGRMLLEHVEVQQDAAELLNLLALVTEELDQPALLATLEHYLEICDANAADPVGKELKRLLIELCQRVENALEPS